MFNSDCTVSSPVIASMTPTLKTLEPYVYSRDGYRASFENAGAVSGVGLGLYDSHEMGPLVPPPTPSLLSSQFSRDAFGQPIVVSAEEQVRSLIHYILSCSYTIQVLKAMPTSKLYIRRHQGQKSSPSVFPLPSPFSPLAVRPQRPRSIHSSPTIITISTSTRVATVSEVDHIGAGLFALNISPPEDDGLTVEAVELHREGGDSRYLTESYGSHPILALERSTSLL